MGNIFSSSDSSDSLSSSSQSYSTKGYKSHQELVACNWYDRIKNKLTKDGNSLDIQSETDLDKLINSLGDEKIFLDRYLRLREVYNNDNLQQIAKDCREINDLRENNFIPSEEDGRNMINTLLQHRRESDKFNVYLFISKLSDGRSDSPMLRFMAKNFTGNKYGMFHVGLEVDGIVLEWGTGDAGPHLIYPRINVNRLYKIAQIRINYDSNFSQEFNDQTNLLSRMWHTLNEFLSDPLSFISKMFETLLSFAVKIGVVPSKKLIIIAQKCVFWNKHISYHPLTRNCQHFIDEMLKALDLKFSPEGEFKKFLDRLTTHADDRFLFREKEFFSRQDLDRYADQNWNKISNTWDKRLLLCYSDMMKCMYKLDENSRWGPIENKERWDEREYELRTD